jgi:hypothetical protein
MFNKSVYPLVFVFLIVAVVILIGRNALQQQGIDWQVVMGGNVIIYVVTIISMHLLSRGMHAQSTHVFLRNAYSGILFKLMACAVAAFIYILLSGKSLNKPGLFVCMGLYLVYSFIEMRIIMKHSKQRKNAEN